MKTITTLTLAAATCIPLAAGGEAQAATIITGNNTNYRLSVSDPVSVGTGAEDLLQVIFTAERVDAGGNPSAFGTIGPQFGIGQGGDLHHEQFPSPFPPFGVATTPTRDSAGDSDIDSHFLVTAAQIVTVTAPNEPVVNPATSAEPGQFGGITGFASPLDGDFALLGGNANPAFSFAQIVSANGTAIDFSFQIGGTDASTTDFAGTYIIPEPASLSLLLVLGAPLLIRRRHADVTTPAIIRS